MGESFKKIKNKYLALAIVKSAILGLVSGLAGVGLAFLVVTLAKFDMQWFYYVIIALGLFLVVGVPVFISDYPNEKKLAKKLDNDYQLKERVQTMVAYKDVDSDLVRMQRIDTDNRLKEVAKKRPLFKDFIAVIIVIVVCISIFVSGLAVNLTSSAENDDPSQHEEPKYEYSLARQNAMLELIDNIERSDLSDETKQDLSNRLKSLHNYFLNNELTVLEVKAGVITEVAYIDAVLESLTTYRTVHQTVSKIDVNFGDAIVASLETYKQYSTQLTSFTNIKKIYKDLIEKDEVKEFASEYINKTKAVLWQTDKEDATYKDIRNKLIGYLNEANIYLADYLSKESKEIAESGEENDNELNLDALMNSLVVLITDLSDYKDKIDGYTDLDGVRSDIERYINTFTQSLSEAMIDEIYPCIMQHFIRNKLASIYDVADKELPKITPDPDFSESVKNDDKKPGNNENASGGGGSGGTLYPSNDMIYDPDTGTYVKYGELASPRYAKVLELLESNDVPQETKKAILEYFKLIQNFENNN